jgi:hypothetical protein
LTEDMRSPKLESIMEPFVLHDVALRQLSTYLRSRWVECICKSCGGLFYKKAAKLSSLCGSFECEGGYQFLISKPPPRQFITPIDIAGKFVEFFDTRAYKKAAAISLTGHGARHIFAGTAGQIFDGAIFRSQPHDTVAYYVAQPVVRMQSSKHDGFLKSFVNISLEQLGSRVVDHLRSFENYLDFLSRVGVYVGDLRIKVYEDRPDWGTGEFRSAVIGVYHDGLEIGVLNYFTDIPQSGRVRLSMSDVSFGLERISWSLNRSHRFVDIVGPTMELVRSTPHGLLDAYRTIVLMLQGGILPERHTQAGSKLRSLFLASICPLAPMRLDLIEYYYQWWARFSEPFVLYNVVVDQWCRQLARQLEDRFGVRSLGAGSPEEVIAELTTKGVLSVRQLRGERYER